MIRHPVSTEKAIRAMESSNKLVFIVDRADSKSVIKKEVEATFQVKVINVNTITNLRGEKRAIVTLSPQTPALDVATKLGMM